MKKRNFAIIAVCALGLLILLGALVLLVPGGPVKELTVVYPHDKSLFPPEIAPTEFVWKDQGSGADSWRIQINYEDGEAPVRARSDSMTWVPERPLWEAIKKRSLEKKATVTIRGERKSLFGKILTRNRTLSEGRVAISTSADSVGAPIFYRDVPLPFNFAKEKMELIQWRLGDISKSEQPPAVLWNMPVCGNCHSFTRDGSVLAMDVDSGGDKGSYVITPIEEQIFLTKEKLITWRDYRSGRELDSFGLLAQVSPDGRYVAANVEDRVIFLGQGGAKIEFSQLFFPVKGIIAYYDREKKQILPIPGADDTNLCQSNPSWSPDSKYIIFARAPLRDFIKKDRTKNPVLTRAQSAIFLGGEQYLEDATTAPAYPFSLYRLPFNEGKGGKPEPVPGASENGMSNYFAKYSPDGRWVVFCRARSFMLLRPDSRLWIMPADFSRSPRELTYQMRIMNSWHSWSPNSRWLVVSSKEHSPYTELFLKHIDENGNDSPPVRLSAFSSPDRARNIPEFVNMRQGGIKRIYESFVDYYSYMRKGETLEGLGKYKEAEESYRKSLEMNPNFAETHHRLASLLTRDNRVEEAQREFETAVRLDPDNADAHYFLGVIYMDEKQYDKAEQALRLAQRAERYDNDPEVYSRIGTIYLIKKDLDKAEKAFERSLSIEPSNPGALHNLGIIYLSRNDLARAEEAFRSVYKLNPDNPGVCMMLAQVLSRNEKTMNEAISLYTKALNLSPQNVQGYVDLGNLYIKAGDRKSALLVFEKALELNPGSRELRAAVEELKRGR